MKQFEKLSATVNIKMNLQNILAGFCLMMTVNAGQEKKYYTIETLNSLQGLRFEKVGSLKLIVETRLLTFNFNLTSMMETIDKGFNTKLQVMESLCGQNDEGCKKEINKLIGKLGRRNDELKNMRHQKFPRSFLRFKRSFPGFMSESDGYKLRKDLEKVLQELKLVLSQHHEAIRLLREANLRLANATEIAHNRTDKIETSLLITKTHFETIELEDKVKAIYRVMANKRMDNELTSSSLFQSKLDDIEKTLNGTNRELPFRNVQEYFDKIETSHRVTEHTLLVEVKVPIVEKNARDLFKIQSIPIRVDDSFAFLETQWSFLANNSNSILTFTNLEPCYESDQATTSYLCELQSPIQLGPDTDWLTKSFRQGKIDISTCMTTVRVVKFSQLTFIKCGDGKYFYFANNNDTLQVSCRGNVENVTLTHLTGLLTMEPGCSAVSDNVKLFVTGRSIETPYWNQNVLNITLDLDDFKRTVERISAPSDSHTQLYENINELRKVWSLAKDPNGIKIEDVSVESEMMSWMMPCLFIFVIILCFTRCIRFVFGK